ncbi:MAG: SAP domain-containing protein [SAR324 cluster bacterium]|nr:SAP domain-containing protein [SAR324 cluster bacterium]
MKINEVRALAKQKGLEKIPKSKKLIIQAMQEAEGSNACYNTGYSGECGQDGCLWLADCQTADSK